MPKAVETKGHNSLEKPGPKIKVCGITRGEDAMELDKIKINYLGFNFVPTSSRFIDPGLAGSIARHLKFSRPVAVFSGSDSAEIQKVMEIFPFPLIQLHGREGMDFVGKLGFPVLYAVPVRRSIEIPKTIPKNLKYMLYDSSVEGKFGGTGESFDWSLLQNNLSKIPYFLAGGIGPHNLEQALSLCKPFALDLNSRVEKSPGVKDLGKVQQCLDIVDRMVTG